VYQGGNSNRSSVPSLAPLPATQWQTRGSLSPSPGGAPAATVKLRGPGRIVFYALDTRLPHAHGVWHLFVIAGSANHYYAILHYVL